MPSAAATPQEPIDPLVWRMVGRVRARRVHVGARRLYLTSLVLFTAGSALCGLSSSLSELIAFRVLQGVGGALILPVGQAALTKAAGPRNMPRIMGAVGVPIILAPVIGSEVGILNRVVEVRTLVPGRRRDPAARRPAARRRLDRRRDPHRRALPPPRRAASADGRGQPRTAAGVAGAFNTTWIWAVVITAWIWAVVITAVALAPAALLARVERSARRARRAPAATPEVAARRSPPDGSPADRSPAARPSAGRSADAAASCVSFPRSCRGAPSPV